MTVYQLYPPADGAENLTIKIVEDETERLKAMLVRAIVYMHEQKCPFHEEFDLNDHTATQIIGLTASGEPVLTARIRYFNGFAKIERLSIRSEFRGKGYGHRLLGFALQLCRQKGYAQFYLHAQLKYQAFYNEYGFKPVGGNFGFSDYEYAEMLLVDTEQHAQPSSQIGVAPMLLNRPENSPFAAGPLEPRSSVERPTLHAN